MQGPVHLQLACIMGERTADEKATFGKIKPSADDATRDICESNIDWILEQYSDETYKLVSDCMERSRDKFAPSSASSKPHPTGRSFLRKKE